MKVKSEIILKKTEPQDREAALTLVRSVFMQYAAPDFSEQGIKTFLDYISDKESMDGLEIYGAFKNEEILGVIATKQEGKHISLFFVKDDYHGQGLGKMLFETVLQESAGSEITVNSSPYAVEIYKRLGFVPDKEEQIVEGIRFVPMTYIK